MTLCRVRLISSNCIWMIPDVNGLQLELDDVYDPLEKALNEILSVLQETDDGVNGALWWLRPS